MTELTLPPLGESVEKGTIISVLVKVGDTIQLDQPLMEVILKALLEDWFLWNL